MLQLNLTIEPGFPERFKAKMNAVMDKLVAKCTEISLNLAAKIAGEKLHGEVLNQVSGRLAGSVQPIEAVREENSIQFGVRAATGAAWYGIVHEYGTEKQYAINVSSKKALRFMMKGKAVFATYVFHPPFPQRSFMNSTLEEERESINEKIREALAEGLAE